MLFPSACSSCARKRSLLGSRYAALLLAVPLLALPAPAGKLAARQHSLYASSWKLAHSVPAPAVMHAVACWAACERSHQHPTFLLYAVAQRLYHALAVLAEDVQDAVKLCWHLYDLLTPLLRAEPGLK